MNDNNNVLLEIKNLTVEFGHNMNKFKAVDNVSFNIYKGETFGLVGESGSGKTTIGRSIIRINDITSGSISYDGRLISGKIKKALDRELTGKMQMIFQDPMSSLNERAKVDYIISEGLYNNRNFKNKDERIAKVEKALSDVGLLHEFASRFPHEFSGGQRQRIGIARALVMEPEFIIADEPISALDVSIRAQVINLLIDLQKKKGLTYLFIAHDLSVMKHFTDRIAVIYKGKIVELSNTDDLFKNPLHPYTKALLSAIPNPNPKTERVKELYIFRPTEYDFKNDPPRFIELSTGHFVLCNKKEQEEYLSIIQ